MERLKNKRLFLLDMDGTLYLDDKLFAGVTEFLEHIHHIGGRYLFLTNNSSKGAEQYVEKMKRLGIPASEEDFFTSVDATILYLKERLGKRLPYHKFYVAGTQSFKRQLRQAGIWVTDKLEEDITWLISGFDTELTFAKLEESCILLKDGVEWIATNPDWVCPTWYGSVPDCGSVCEMLARATGRRPEFIGKPQPLMAEAAVESSGFQKEQTVLIGDRIYTDIACGVNAGIDTILVLSGETDREMANASGIKPTWILEDIEELLKNMQ